MEGAAAGVAAGSAAPITAVASMGAEAGAVAHELCVIDATLGLLGRQLGNAIQVCLEWFSGCVCVRTFVSTCAKWCDLDDQRADLSTSFTPKFLDGGFSL